MEKRPRVGEILLEAGVIDEMQLLAALGDQANWGARLGLTLVKMGLIAERDLVWALAQQLQIPLVRLEGKRIQREVLDLVPVELAEKYTCIPLFVRQNEGFQTLFVGMDDPANLEALDDLGFLTSLRIRPVLASASELTEAIDRFYHRSGSARASESGEARASVPDEGAGEKQDTTLQRGTESIPEIEELLLSEVCVIDEAASGEIRRMTSLSDADSREAGPGKPKKPAKREQKARQPAASAEAAPAPHGGPDDKNRTVLHALCRLLVEKGVIGRSELQKVVSELALK